MDKGLVIKLSKDLSKGYYDFNEKIHGTVSQDIATQLKNYAAPINQKLQALMTTVDKTVTSLQGFWDETATTEIEGSMKELRNSISRLGNVAIQVEDLVATEKVKLGRIFSNVESISANLKASNDKIEGIIGNTKKITDDLVSADYKAVIMDAQNSIKKLNVMLEDINNGHGTLGKLVKDEKLYNELVETNNDLQNLLKDLELHPERYIHFSVLGARTKGANFTPNEEKKIRQVIDTIPE
jgi:phospholipid/cholesterol/gamma-HCH transport system substrate-binding protein